MHPTRRVTIISKRNRDQKEERKVELYGDGTIKSEQYRAYGLKDGIARTWYPNGKIHTLETWCHGKKSGAFTTLDVDGNMILQEFYAFNKLLSRHNRWTLLLPIEQIKDGFNDCQLDSDEHMWQGVRVEDLVGNDISANTWWPREKYRRTWYCANGKKEGREEKWSTDGKLVLQQDLVTHNDQPVVHGIRREWNKSGEHVTYWALGEKINEAGYMDWMKSYATQSAEWAALRPELGRIIAGYAY